MADLRGEQLKDSYQNVVTRGTGNKLENGNGVEFADLDDKASLSAINNDPEFYEEGSYTPIIGTTGDPFDSFSYLRQTGIYVKTGNTVMVQAALRTSSELTGGSGSVTVTLPFTAFDIEGATTEGSVYIGGAGRNSTDNARIVSSIVNNGASFARFRKGDFSIYSATDDIRGFGFVITYRI